MGCICSIIASFISHILYFSQKFLFCFTCAALVSCLVMTFILTLGMGIGIGYNYCYVDFKTKHRYVPAKYRKYNPTPHWRRSAPTDVTLTDTNNINNLRVAENVTESVSININATDKLTKENITEDLEAPNEIYPKNEISHETTEESPKMIIPISGLDLIALLSKLRSENRNYSLQIVTT